MNIGCSSSLHSSFNLAANVFSEISAGQCKVKVTNYNTEATWNLCIKATDAKSFTKMVDNLKLIVINLNLITGFEHNKVFEVTETGTLKYTILLSSKYQEFDLYAS